jgi:hypothetical protein
MDINIRNMTLLCTFRIHVLKVYNYTLKKDLLWRKERIYDL